MPAPRAEVRPATEADIALIEPRIQDLVELWRAFRQTPEEAMRLGITHGRAWYGEIDGQPAAMFGVVPHGRTGVPWAIFTRVVERYPIAFLKACREPLRAMQAEFDELVNYVDASNTKAIGWLVHLGFTVHPAEAFGIEGKQFHRFDWHV